MPNAPLMPMATAVWLVENIKVIASSPNIDVKFKEKLHNF